MKECYRCKKMKTMDDFYTHKAMGDGYLGKCKKCCRFEASNNYSVNRDYFRAYDIRRNKDPERIKSRRLQSRIYYLKNPERTLVHRITSNGIRDGKIIRKPCQVCGKKKSQAHHDDYSRPLSITWLCFKHHREIKHHQKVG